MLWSHRQASASSLHLIKPEAHDVIDGQLLGKSLVLGTQTDISIQTQPSSAADPCDDYAITDLRAVFSCWPAFWQFWLTALCLIGIFAPHQLGIWVEASCILCKCAVKGRDADRGTLQETQTSCAA